MKKILFLLIAAMLVSCDKAFINGDLDGMWHLESVASPEPPTATTIPCCPRSRP